MVNRNFEQIAHRYIHMDLNVHNIVAWDRKLACLFYSKSSRLFHLDLFDQHLSLKGSKSFNYNLKLCSMNDHEILCWNQSAEKCVVLDLDLNVLNEYGQSESVDRPFYFSGGTLIDASATRFLYYCADCDQQKQCIKIVDRETGDPIGQIDFDFLYFTKIIKLDSRSNILVKLSQNNLIQYYDPYGRLLNEFRINKFNSLIEFNLTRQDQIVCYDKGEKKIFVL